MTEGVRPTRLEVDLARLRENYRAIAAHVAPARVMPVLKANAYGHGLVAVARALERERPFAVAVAYLEEAIRLREGGVRTAVLVLGDIVGAQIPRFLEHDVTLTASSVDKLLAIEACAVARHTTARPVASGRKLRPCMVGAGGRPAKSNNVGATSIFNTISSRTVPAGTRRG